MPLEYGLTYSHRFLSGHLRPGDWALDGTAGNGHDTLFLARAVGVQGRVFAFDIQPHAIAATTSRLQDAGVLERCQLFLAGHETLADHLPAVAKGRLRAAMFNLGYLPKSDTPIITRPETTVAALQSLEEWLAPGGVISVFCYLGHDGGGDEGAAVAAYCQGLAWEQWRVLQYSFSNQPTNATVLYLLERRQGR